MRIPAPTRSAKNWAMAPDYFRRNGAFNANINRKTALARDRARELVTLAQNSSDGELLLEAYHCRWSTAFFRGDVSDALDDCRNGIELYDMDRHRHLGHAFGGHDPGVCAHVQCGTGIMQAMRETIGMVEHLHHQLGADRDTTYAAAHRAAELAEKFGLMPWRAGSLVLAAWATARSGQASWTRRV
jgi:hypothetical protein